MAERDAFGREIDDDSLKNLGWGTSDTPSAPPVPAPPPTPMAPPVNTPITSSRDFGGGGTNTLPTSLPNIPGGRRRSGGSGLGKIVGLLIVFGILGAVAAAVIPAVNSVKDTVNSVTNSFSVPSVSVPGIAVENGTTSITETDAPGEQKPATPPKGLQPRSMLRADALARTLPALRKIGANAQTVRIDAERINATIVTATNKQRIAQIDWAGTSNVVKVPVAPPAALGRFSLSSLSSKAPSRAVARACALLKRPATQVNYLVVSKILGKLSIYVYFKDGTYVRASGDGRQVQRV